jgi:hypothetical protein
VTTNSNVVNFGFEPPTLAERKAAVHRLLEVLPKNTEPRKVAEGVKNQGADFEDVFIEWAVSVGFGRYKARHLWAKVKGDPDAWEDISDDFKAEAARRGRFTLLDDIGLNGIQQFPWLIQKTFPKKGNAAVYGPSGSGKSFVVIDMGCCIAEGESWFGYQTKATPVLYVGLEGAAGIKGRFDAWKRYKQRDRLPNNLRILLPESFRLTDARDVKELAETINAAGVQECVVIIDTLNRAAPDVDENSSRDMGRVIEAVKQLQQLTGGLVVLVAHTGKNTAMGLRGHSSLIAVLDAAIIVERNFDVRSWKVDKLKDAADGIEHGFKLAVVPIGTDEFGGELTSCVVVPDASLIAKAERSLSKGAHFAKHTFEVAIKEFDNPQVHFTNWQKVYYRMSPSGSDAAKQRAFHRARQELIDAGKLRVENNVYCLTEPGSALAEQCRQAVPDSRHGPDNVQTCLPDRHRQAPI